MPQDSQLQQAVLAEFACEQFAWEPSVTAAHIGITSCEGAVTLTGHFESSARRRAARWVKGVMPWRIRAVAERIELRLPSDMEHGVEKVAVAAVNSLSWDVSRPCGSVKVEAEKVWVALNGQVDPDHRREAVGENISIPVDIRGVFNEITDSTRVNAAGGDNEINDALHRSWFLSPDDVRAAAEGGTVCLASAIQTPHDREVVAATAWAAPGAAPVLNGIVLTASF